MIDLTQVNRPFMSGMRGLGNDAQIRELVERAIKRGWCQRTITRPLRDEEIENLKRRLTELETQEEIVE